MTLAFPMTAQESDSKSTSKPITLEAHKKDDRPHNPIHRAPMRIPVEAWYDTATETISILYFGEATGEANLYKDGLLIERSFDINTTFAVSEAGFYTIGIMTDSWTASGSINIE